MALPMDERKDRAEKIAVYMIKTGATVRVTAEKFKVGKTLIHDEVTQILPLCNPKLAKEVRKVLDKNKSERCVRGGKATQRKRKVKKSEMLITSSNASLVIEEQL